MATTAIHNIPPTTTVPGTVSIQARTAYVIDRRDHETSTTYTTITVTVTSTRPSAGFEEAVTIAGALPTMGPERKPIMADLGGEDNAIEIMVSNGAYGGQEGTLTPALTGGSAGPEQTGSHDGARPDGSKHDVKAGGHKSGGARLRVKLALPILLALAPVFTLVFH